MKRWLLPMMITTLSCLYFSCKHTYYVHHTVRMVDAKSYMDHPLSVNLTYYYH